jgi:general secretion pathway protein D
VKRFLICMYWRLFCCWLPAFRLPVPLPSRHRDELHDVEIATMVKFISELTGKNFVLDDRVKGKVSIFSPSKLSIDEAFALFSSVLELKGFTLVQTGKIYKVVPTAGAKQSGMRLVDKERVPAG